MELGLDDVGGLHSSKLRSRMKLKESSQAVDVGETPSPTALFSNRNIQITMKSGNNPSKIGLLTP